MGGWFEYMTLTIAEPVLLETVRVCGLLIHPDLFARRNFQLFC
jgi:hypothetical protein